MRENCTCSLGGGRRPARQRASSDPTPRNHSNQDGTRSAETEEGRLRIKENPFPFDTHPTLSGTERVPRVGECGTSVMLGSYSSAIRAACANERSCGSVRGAISDGRPYRHLINHEEKKFSCGSNAGCVWKSAYETESL